MRGVGVAIALVVVLASCGPARTSETPSATPKAAAGADAGLAEEIAESDAGAAEDEDGVPGTEDVATGDARCPEGMVVVETSDRSFCIDRFEASLVEVLEGGAEQPYPHYKPVDGHAVRAVSVPGVMPQGFISEVQAQDACAASGKRLCAYPEWKTACMGPERTAFPYGDTRKPGVCHDQGKSAVLAVFGAKAVLASAVPVPAGTRHGIAPSPATSTAKKKPANVTRGRAAQTVKTRPTKGTKPGKSAAPAPKGTTKKRIAGKASTRPSNVDPGVWAKLNDPGLGQVEGALSATGSHEACVNAWGVHDMVGNLHEWVATDAAAPHGTFAGGYYLDTALNGDGCHYRTVAHAHDYHDYSTGFRCCADLAADR